MKNEIIVNILSIPIEFNKANDKSFYQLLRDMNYAKYKSVIFEHDILEVLKNKSEIIDYWLEWSDNKRTTTGWYFKKYECDVYIVGFFSLNDKDNQYMEFNSKFIACSCFIKREIDECLLQ